MSDVDPSPTHAGEYRATRARVRDLLCSRDLVTLEAPSPATPKWRVRDVLAHMVGVVDDVLNERLDGVTTEPWTDAHISARRERSVPEMLDEWDRLAPAFETQLEQVPHLISGQVLFDAVTHELDMRHALATGGARDTRAIRMMFDWMVEVRTQTQMPALRFDTGDDAVVGGTGELITTVSTAEFEFVRAVTGRRSRSELEHYGWDPPADVSTILIAPFFRIRDEPLNE